MKQIQAFKNAVVVLPIELEESNFGNIIVPDMGNDKNPVGKVVSVGPGHETVMGNLIETSLKEGDIVVLPTMGFTKFSFQGEEYYVGKENEVLAIIK
jgi:chaperonin GroES